MLAKIREKTQGIIATLILGFVAIPFVLWGIGSYFEGNSSVAVAEVNGTEISQQTYRERLDELRGLDPRRAENRAVKEMVVESLVEQTLLVAHAEEHGYRLSDVRLAQLIHEIPNFRRDGKFDGALYEALLRQQGLRPAEFEARLRQESITTQVQRGLSETAFVTEADIAAMVRMLTQERRVSYAIVGTDGFLPKTAVSASEVEAYYQSNQESFSAPEAVRIEYVALKGRDVAQQVQPSDAELRQAYDAESARYVTPAKRKVSHILINVPTGADASADQAAKARIDDLSKQVRAGADFAALAKKHSQDTESAAKGGDLGDAAAGVLPPELEAAANALKPGEVSQPVRTAYGYHLVKLTSYQPEQRKTYESVKQELADQVRRRKGEERFFELGERLRDLAYEHPEGLHPVAKELGLPIQTSDWFTRSGGSGIASRPRVVSAAFEPEVLSRQRNSDAIEVDAETLMALRVIEHRPSAVRPLAEVRPVIERTLKEMRARQQAQAAAHAWIEKLEQGAKLNAQSRPAGATVEPGKTITRERSGGVDKRIVDAVFAAPRPANRPVVGLVDLGKQGYAVYALEAVRDVDAATVDGTLKEKVRRQLAQRTGADYYAGYRAGIRKSADVKINKDNL